MNRSQLNLTIDLLAAAGLLVMVATGYILRFPLPPTSNRTHELWGMSRHEWGTIHAWASIALLVVLTVHLVLHWEWLFAMIRLRFTKTRAAPGTRSRAGILTIVALAIIGVAFAWASHAGVRERDTPLHSVGEPAALTALAPDRAPLPPTIAFQQDVWPIFATSCIGCHGPKKQRADFRADRRADFFKPRDAAPLIVPGAPERSRLIAIVAGEVPTMKSAEDHLLPDREIELLRAWIVAGAEWPENPLLDQR